MGRNMVELGPLVDDVSLDLYHAATGLQQSGNLMISPLSMLYATVLIYLGSKGNTKANLDASLHFNKTFSKSDSDVVGAFGQLMGQFKLSNFDSPNATRKDQDSAIRDQGMRFDMLDGVKGKLTLALANAVFIENTYSVSRAYLNTVNRELKATAMKMDFRNHPEPARTDISKWAEDRTGGKIKDLIQNGAITSAVKAVLANAVYFKASWANIFDESDTKREKFMLLGGSLRDVDMMHLCCKRMPYWADISTQYLEIPYAHKEASLLVLLPKDKKGCGIWKRSQRATCFTRWLLLRTAVRKRT